MINLKNKIAKFLMCLCTVSFIFLLASCNDFSEISENNSNGNQTQNNSQNSGSEQNSNLNQDNIQSYTNNLTGLEISQDIINRRPTAVMINNIRIAQPLLGISKADIVYECLVEGGITRLLAVYKDISAVGSIGSIRSVRPNYLSLARGLDAAILYNGTSTQAKNIIKSEKLSAYDIGYYDNTCWRDDYRRKNLGYEHSLLTSGSMLDNLLAKVGERKTSDYSNGLIFDNNNSQVNNGNYANEVKVTFSGIKTTTFKYDSASKDYNIFQYGTNQYDDYYKVNNTAKNVIAIFVECKTIDSEGHIDMKLVSSGEGYYICEGKYIKIKWSKSSEDSPILFKDENGNNLIMKTGRQYVCCVPQYGSVDISESYN